MLFSPHCRSTAANNETPTTFTITYDLNPAADATFEGIAARTLAYTADLREDGIVIENAGGTEYFQVNPYRHLGTRYNDSTYEVAANQVNLPTTAKIGDSGDFYTSTTYTNDSKTTVEETAIVRWSMERDPGSKSRAYFCVNQEVTFPIPVADDVKSVASCYRLDEAGSILSVRLTYISADGSRITFD